MDSAPGTTPNTSNNWKLTLCYDGSSYAGWQIQPGRATVQGELVRALLRVTGEQTLPQGSGRTDAGVHALAQVASVRLLSPIPAQNLLRALNHVLPRAIRVLDTQQAPAGFHARHSAVAKQYEYRVWRPTYCPPWTAPYVYPFDYPLAIDALSEAAAQVVGTHNFLSFQAHEPDVARRASARPGLTIRTIFSSVWEQPAPELLVYRVQGSGFLHHMVRNLVGTFLDVGRGLIAAADLPAILAARARAAAGPTAPAGGLWLHSVEYPDPMLR